MKHYTVTNGKYQNFTGKGKLTKYGTVMFYPDNGRPYCVCLLTSDVKEIHV